MAPQTLIICYYYTVILREPPQVNSDFQKNEKLFKTILATKNNKIINMSLAMNPIKTVRIKEPAIDIDEDKVFAIFTGGQDNTYYNYPANAYSTTQATWNINTPSERIIIDRKIYLRARVRLQLTGPDLGKLLIQSGRDAPRAFPLTNSMSALNVQINNSQVTITMADVMKGVQRYMDERELYQEYSNSPCYPDQSQTYSELAGFLRNPLNHAGDSIYGAIEPRGAYPVTINSLTNTTADIEFDFCEPLMISPLHFNKSLTNGFIGVKNLSVVIQWKSNLINTIWSRNEDDGLFDSAAVTFNGAPELLVRNITPSELVMQDLPENSVYPYHHIQSFQTNLPSLAAGLQNTRTNESIQVSVIPRRMFIYLIREQSEERYDRPDSYMSIEDISINFANRSGLLASASKRDLYNISKKNGVNLTWREWSGDVSHAIVGTDNELTGVGSVLCVYVPEDITIFNSDLLAPGVVEKTNLQVTVTYKNLHPTETITPRLMIVTQTDGIFTIQNGLSYQQTGIISQEDVLNSKFMKGIEYEDVLDIYGGDLFSDIKSFVKKIPGAIKEGVKFAKEDVLPVAEAVMQILPLLGLGVKSTGHGGLLIGGKKVSREQLRKRLEGAMMM